MDWPSTVGARAFVAEDRIREAMANGQTKGLSIEPAINEKSRKSVSFAAYLSRRNAAPFEP